MSEIRDIIQENLEELQGLLQEGENLDIQPKSIRLVRWGSVISRGAGTVADRLEGRADVGQPPGMAEMTTLYETVFNEFEKELDRYATEIFLHPLPFTQVRRLAMLAATVAERCVTIAEDNHEQKA